MLRTSKSKKLCTSSEVSESNESSGNILPELYYNNKSHTILKFCCILVNILHINFFLLGTSQTSSAKRFKKSSQDTWTEVGKAKLNLIKMQKRSFLEEHTLKMKKLKMEYDILLYELEYKKKLFADKN